jgi:hypothetical protein
LLADVTLVAAQPLKRDPTPQDYVERNGGGATIVRPGELVLDGHRISCGKWATILDPNLNDYAASYPQFVILNMRYVASVPTAVQLWISVMNVCTCSARRTRTRPTAVPSNAAAVLAGWTRAEWSKCASSSAPGDPMPPTPAVPTVAI